jgi:hypothetical protein
VLTVSTPLVAQRRPPGSTPQESTVGAAIALSVGGMTYAFTGKAECEHLAGGSIYDTVAERWSVQQQDNGRSLNLNLWHPMSGGSDMVMLSISLGGKTYTLDTVKRPQSAQTTGSGTVKLVPQGNGGTFTVNGKAGSGAAISGTIKCDSFTASNPVAG